MSSAAEARFRIQTPLPTTRAVKVIPLDPDSDRVVAGLARGAWNGVAFFTASALVDLVDEVATADLVVMVTTAGADAHAAAIIGEACSGRRVPTATFVVGAASGTDEALSKTLAQVRPWSLMVVIAGDDDYVEEILRSFR